MTTRKLFFLFLLFLCISCKQDSKSFEYTSIKVAIANKDHVIQLANGTVVYALYKNIHKYDMYIFNQNLLVQKKENLTFLNKNLTKTIFIGMKKADVIKILGEPPLVNENQFTYFQNYVDFTICKISAGIDRRIFEIKFENDKIVYFGEKYIPRA